MWTEYKKGIKKYFTSWLGYFAIGVLLLVSGFFFILKNIIGHSLDLQEMFRYSYLLLLIVVPFCISAFKGGGIGSFFGHLLATISIILVTAALMFVYIIIMYIMVEATVSVMLTQILGFILLGIALTAIGMFIVLNVGSSKTALWVTLSIFGSVFLLSRILDLLKLSGYLDWLMPLQRSEYFLNGVLSGANIYYFITLIAVPLLFSFLTIKKTFNVKLYAALLTFIILFNFPAIGLFEIDFKEEISTLLSNETKSVLRDIDEDIRIFMFYKEGEGPDVVQDIARRYNLISPRIKTFVLDPYISPEIPRKYQTLGHEIDYGSVIIESANDFRIFRDNELYMREKVTGKYISISAESQITSAIVTMTNRQSVRIGLTTGHQEKELKDTELERIINKEESIIEKVRLSESIPENMNLIMIVDPRTDFTAGEINALEKFTSNGGMLQIYRHNTKNTPLANLDAFIASWGIEYTDEIVLESDDQKVANANPAYILPSFAKHSITNRLIDNNNLVVTPFAAGIRVNHQEGIKYTNLLETTAETSYIKGDNTSLNVEREEEDIAGPFTLAVLAEKNAGEDNASSVIFFGNPNFLNVETLSTNKEFILSTILWQSTRYELPYVPTKKLSINDINFTLDDMKMSIIIVISLSAAVFFIGALVQIWYEKSERLKLWGKRRKPQ